MSQQNIYSIQLLNDLHNHFPDVLYNPGRFHNIQDLLYYIRTIADMSPYERGLIQYNTRMNIRPTYPPAGPATPPPPPLQPAPATPAPLQPAPATHAPLPVRNPVQVFTFEENIPYTATTNAAAVNATNNIINTLLNELLFSNTLGRMATTPGTINLNAFLNERVPVFPTTDEINAATTLHTAISRQEDICAICQDEIETNQEMRRLNHCHHYFHRHCIDTWFQTNVNCPTCRHDIREQPAANQSGSAVGGGTNQPPPVPENHRRMSIRRTH